MGSILSYLKKKWFPKPFKPEKSQAPRQNHAQCPAVPRAGGVEARGGGGKHKPSAAEGVNRSKWEQVLVLGSLWVRWVDGWTDERRCAMTER